MKQPELPLDGFCCGPLFQPPVKRRPPRDRSSGGREVWIKYTRALPPWTTTGECRAFWDESRRMTEATGIQHSVDHIVPLVHPLVCGLHCPANLHVIPLAENVRKSNNWWPDMPECQAPLFSEH